MRRNSGIIGASKSVGVEISAINGMYDSFDALSEDTKAVINI